jgi:programmed cell death protein 5
MDNIAQANFDPRDLPDGFTSADPNAGPAVGKSDETKGKEEQKQAILQQALMPDALARLRRIKVRCR